MAQAPHRILVADDEPEILSEIISYLHRRGEVAFGAPSFGGAMRAFNDDSDSIALVITDVRMPDGNGLDLARWVIDRSHGKCPCVLMTGHLDRAGLGSDLAAAGVRILDKPFGMSALYAMVLHTRKNTDRQSINA
jgi:two-component system, NtrC family, response regulator PilR